MIVEGRPRDWVSFSDVVLGFSEYWCFGVLGSGAVLSGTDTDFTTWSPNDKRDPRRETPQNAFCRSQ